MAEWFRLGGWGMWPTTLFGAVLLVTAVRYAARPDESQRERLTLLVWITLVSGLLGFLTGLVRSCLAIGEVKAEEHFLVIIGLGESLVNVAWALGWIELALLLKLAGLWRTRPPGA